MLTALIVHTLFHILPPCQYEDSRNCSWHATSAGNGKGRSFIDVNGKAYYLDGKGRSHR